MFTIYNSPQLDLHATAFLFDFSSPKVKCKTKGENIIGKYTGLSFRATCHSLTKRSELLLEPNHVFKACMPYPTVCHDALQEDDYLKTEFSMERIRSRL